MIRQTVHNSIKHKYYETECNTHMNFYNRLEFKKFHFSKGLIQALYPHYHRNTHLPLLFPSGKAEAPTYGN